MVMECNVTFSGKNTMQYTDEWCIIGLYTWNPYNFINQCHPKKFNKKNLKSIIGKTFKKLKRIGKQYLYD